MSMCVFVYMSIHRYANVRVGQGSICQVSFFRHHSSCDFFFLKTGSLIGLIGLDLAGEPGWLTS